MQLPTTHLSTALFLLYMVTFLLASHKLALHLRDGSRVLGPERFDDTGSENVQ